MKLKTTIFLFLFIFCWINFSFSQTKNYFYSPVDENGSMEKIAFHYSNEKILIGFSKENQKIISTFLNQISFSSVLKNIIYYGDKAELFLQKGLNEKQIESILIELKKQNEVKYAYPFVINVNNPSEERGLTNILIVKLKKITKAAELIKLANQYELKITSDEYHPESLFYCEMNKISSLNSQELANLFYETNLFEYVDVNYWIQIYPFIAAPVNDPLYKDQWSYNNTGTNIKNGKPGVDMKIKNAWKYATGCGIKVAIIDNGVELNHPDLKNNLLPGYDATGSGLMGGADVTKYMHGHTLAGIIGAEADNKIGIAGIAYSSRIIPIQCYVDYKDGDKVEIKWHIQAFQYASIKAKADVINYSIGIEVRTAAFIDAIKDAAFNGRDGKGCIIVTAVGNSNNSNIAFPSNLSFVLAVGASTQCDERKRSSSDPSRVKKPVIADPQGVSCDGREDWGSNYGEGLDLMAPGVTILTTDYSGSYGESPEDYLTVEGTSVAAPSVAGIVALVLSANPNLTREQVFKILFSTADKMPRYLYWADPKDPTLGWNRETGYGRVNAEKAVKKAMIPISIDGPSVVFQGDTVTFSCVPPAGYAISWDFDWHRLKAVSFTVNSISVRVTDRYFDKSTYTYKMYGDTVVGVRVFYTDSKTGSCPVASESKYVLITKEKEIIKGPNILTSTEREYQISNQFNLDTDAQVKWTSTPFIDVIPSMIKNKTIAKGISPGAAEIQVEINNYEIGYAFRFSKDLWIATEIEGNSILAKGETYVVNLGRFGKVSKWTVSSNIKVVKQNDFSIEVEPLSMSGNGWIQAEFDGNVLKKDIQLASSFSTLVGLSNYEVYPNPSEGTVFIKNNTKENFQLEIYHMQLGKIYERSFSDVGQEINLGKLTKGIYCITTISQSGIVEKKLLVVN